MSNFVVQKRENKNAWSKKTISFVVVCVFNRMR